jgi:hypothetical protein
VPRVTERKAIGLIGLLVLLLGCGGKGEEKLFVADHPAAQATLSADSAGLGDPVRLRVEAIVPKGARVAIEMAGDSIQGWRVLHAEPAVQKEEGRFDHWSRDLTVASYRLGAIGPDTLRVRAVTAQGESLRLAYAPRVLHVGGMLKPGDPADPSKARDIRDVLTTGAPIWPRIVAAAVAVLSGIWLFVRRIRRRKGLIPEAELPPRPSPEEEFEAAIASLLAEGLLERGLYREFYYGVSSAVRLYLERKSGLPLLESTSAEVISLLDRGITGEFERVALRDWLSEGDLVKYARMERLQGEANRYLIRSRDLVKTLSKSWEPRSPEPGPGQSETPRPPQMETPRPPQPEVPQPHRPEAERPDAGRPDPARPATPGTRPGSEEAS